MFGAMCPGRRVLHGQGWQLAGGVRTVFSVSLERPRFPSGADCTALPQEAFLGGLWRAEAPGSGRVLSQHQLLLLLGRRFWVSPLELNWSWRTEINRASLFTGLLRSPFRSPHGEGFVLNLVGFRLVAQARTRPPSRRLGRAALSVSVQSLRSWGLSSPRLPRLCDYSRARPSYRTPTRATRRPGIEVRGARITCSAAATLASAVSRLCGGEGLGEDAGSPWGICPRGCSLLTGSQVGLRTPPPDHWAPTPSLAFPAGHTLMFSRSKEPRRGEVPWMSPFLLEAQTMT